MLYKEIAGDFSIETKIKLTKSATTEMPDKGFQQGGIIIRKREDLKENYVFLSLGTGGNPAPKIIFKKTVGGKSKTNAERSDNLDGWLRLEKKGKKIIALTKNQNNDDWKKAGEYEADWIDGTIQTGLAVYAGFPGDGPNMKPDMKVEFTQLKIEIQ
jgi:hypothetical protein